MSDGRWYFPPDSLSRWRGLNSGDTEHFRRSPITSLAREVIQNSLDASDGTGRPVVVSFDLLSVPIEDFPDAKGLKSKLLLAKETNQNSRDERTSAALEHGLNLLQRSSVQVLRISEVNTKGMAGPYYDISSPFFAYTKGSGLSQKEDGKIGSFGIGKKAPMANSGLRTIFVSTKYSDSEGHEHFLCQGLADWVSHLDPDDSRSIIDGSGFWGFGGRSDPANSEAELPLWLHRSGVGTNIYVCGFNPEHTKKWVHVLVSSVLSSFFASIYTGKLEVIADGFEVNKNSIKSIFENEALIEVLKELENEEHFDKFINAKYFYLCLTSEEAIELSTQVQDPLGHFSIKVLLGENLPRSVGFIRDGMFINSNCISSLKRFSNTLDFSAIVECKSVSGNKVLREMEPPEHNNFEGMRYSGGQKLLNILGKKIREQLNKVISPEFGEEASVEFMSDLFGIESEEGTQNTSSAVEINPNGRIRQTIKATLQRLPRQTSRETDLFDVDGNGVTSGIGPTSNNGGGAGAGVRSGPGDNEGAPADKGSNQLGAELEVFNPRTIRQNDGGVQTFVTLPKKGDFLIKFDISGSDQDESLGVISTNRGQPFQGGVIIHTDAAHERVEFTVKLESNLQAAIVVKAYEI